MNVQEQIAYFEQRLKEDREFAAKMREASAKDAHLFSPLPLFFASFFGGALCFFAGMVTMKLLG